MLMGVTSSLDPLTAPFESGMRRVVLHSGILLKGMRAWCNPLLTLRMHSTSFLDLLVKPLMC